MLAWSFDASLAAALPGPHCLPADETAAAPAEVHREAKRPRPLAAAAAAAAAATLPRVALPQSSAEPALAWLIATLSAMGGCEVVREQNAAGDAAVGVTVWLPAWRGLRRRRRRLGLQPADRIPCDGASGPSAAGASAPLLACRLCVIPGEPYAALIPQLLTGSKDVGHELLAFLAAEASDAINQ